MDDKRLYHKIQEAVRKLDLVYLASLNKSDLQSFYSIQGENFLLSLIKSADKAKCHCSDLRNIVTKALESACDPTENKRGFDPTESKRVGDYSAIEIAFHSSNLEFLLGLLFSTGCSPDSINSRNESLYHCSKNSEEISLATNLGTDIHATNYLGNTPIFSYFGGDSERTRINELVALGAQLDAKNNFGDTSLHNAIRCRNYFKSIHKSFSTSRNPNSPSDPDNLVVMIKMGLADLTLDSAVNHIKHLLGAGAMPSILNNDLLTPLDLLYSIPDHPKHFEIRDLLKRVQAKTNASWFVQKQRDVAAMRKKWSL